MHYAQQWKTLFYQSFTLQFVEGKVKVKVNVDLYSACLLYTSDAADE